MMEFDTEPQSDRPLSLNVLGDENRYRLEQKVGQGGMGEVFLAIDTRLHRPVALKLLNPILVNSQTARHRFKQECAICAALESPHIVQVSDFGITAEGYPFYVMEYLQGETLRQRLMQQQRLTVEQAFDIIRQICAGLQVAHRGVVLEDPETQTRQLFKVVHRDLKPDNVFLLPTALGELVKIIDFGIAKIRSLQSNTEVTQSLLGTSHYAAPEQFETAALDERADIYSLGLMLYEMLSGTDPYGLGFDTGNPDRSVSNTAWLTAHLTKAVIPLHSQPGCTQVSPAIEAVVLRCLAKSPGERFASVEALSQTLQAAVGQSSAVSLMQSGLDRLMQSSGHLADAGHPTEEPVLNGFLRFWPGRFPQRALPGLLTGLVMGGLTMGGIVLLRNALESRPVAPETSENQRLVQTLIGHRSPVWTLALSADNQTLISGDEAGMIKLWNLPTGQVERTLTSPSGPVRSLSLSEDGQRFASGGNQIQIWTLPDGQLESSYAQSAWAVALSSDHQSLVSGSEDGLIRIWNLNSGQFRTLAGHQAAVYAVAVSPDQSVIVSGSQDKTVKVWDMKSEALINTFTGHEDVVRAIDFNAQTNQIASGSWDKTVKIWDLKTKTLLHTLQGHQDRVVAVAFSADGRILATGSRDRTIKLWDVQTGKLLQSLSGHTDWVLAVGVSRDGASVVSGSRDQRIKIWR